MNATPTQPPTASSCNRWLSEAEASPSPRDATPTPEPPATMPPHPVDTP